MAATEVSLLFTKRGGRDTWDKHRTYTREYEVLTDDPADDEQVAGAAAGLPRLGDELDSDSDAVAVSVDCQQSDDSPMIWYVTIEYDTDPPQSSDRNSPERRVDFDGNEISKDRPANPLLEPATWKLTMMDTDEPVAEWREVNESGVIQVINPDQWVGDTPYKRGKYVKNNGRVYLCVGATDGDADGLTKSAIGAGPMGVSETTDGELVWAYWDTLANVLNDPNACIYAAALNSARFPFDPPAMTTVSRPVLSVTKNAPIATLEYLLALKNAVNVIPWRGVPARCAKVLKVEHDGGKQLNGFPYVTTQWEIALDPDTFDLRLLDAGFGQIKTRFDALGAPKQVFVRFMDANNEVMDEPTLLNGAGGALKPGDDPVFRRGIPRQVRLIDFNSVLPF